MRPRSTSPEPIGAALAADGPTTVGERSLFGLTQADAAARLSTIGPNRIVAKERLAWFTRLMALLADPMAIMLGGASVLYFLLGDTTDGIIMAAALVPVLGVDVFLEARSSAALAKLAQALRPLAHVIRDGAPKTVPTEALVPGDLLALEEGDVVHADGVVREASNLALDESSLTGESEPQAKRTWQGTGAPEERQQVFAGSLVLAGKGLVEVFSTGPKTRFGHIAQLMVVANATKTPLQRRTGKLVRWLSLVALVVATAVSALELLRGQSWQHALLIAISLAMAAIPEEYPLVLTLFLSVGAFRLGKLGVLVRRLASVETLGSTTVICTDKTGTLTAGTFVLDETVCLTPALSQATLLELAVLACEPAPVDPMERAIDHYAAAHGVDPLAVRTAWQLTEDNDFDAVGKHMSHGYRSADGTRARVAAKGALEGILEHCTVTPEERKRAEAENARLASAGMRVLALAMKEVASLSGTRATDEAGLTLVGLLGYRDPLRPEVPAAVAECRAAGIDLKMITGDHALTARAIAEAAGIARAEAVVTGAELETLEPEAFAQKVRDAALFARISPAQKHAIVAALKASGEVVAMTGDGINDAPALRLSDIGISMGKRGTEVARASSDLVLLDDNFASIVATVREGRHIFQNLQAAFLYILAFHVPVVSLAFLAPALGMPPLLMPVHLVWLELIIHPVSAVVFQAEPAPAGLMLAPPRPPKAPLLPRAAALRSVLAGLALTLAVTWLYVGHQAQGEVAARSLAWATLLLGYQVLVLVEWGALRGKGSTLLPHKPVVWALWSVCGASLPIAMAIGPLARALHLQQLSLRDWGLALSVALAATAWRAPLDRFRPVRREMRRPSITLGGVSGSLLAVSLCLLSAVGCRHPVTASGGPPKNPAEPSVGCIGDAPLDEEVRQVPGVRASWVNAPDGSKRLYVLEAGPRSRRRPTLVLIHGVGAVGTGDFYPVLGALSRTRHVLAVDLPGFGRSNMNSDDLGPEKLFLSVDAVSRVCASEKIDVLGHSTGGGLALLVAARRAESVRRLVIVGAAGILRPDVLLRGQLHEQLTGMRANAPVAGQMVEKMGDFLIAALSAVTTSATGVADSGIVGRSPQVLAAAGLLDYDFGEAIRAIRAPTLILWGKDDNVVPPRIARLLEDRIEHAEVQFIDGAGHVPMKDQPELFASLVSGFLDTPAPPKHSPKPPNASTRVGRCEGQENLILEGDYARVEVHDCKHIWLNRVRAKQILIKDSEGRIDNSEVSAGMTVEKSELALTGGELRGEVALEASDSKLDIAGVAIVGDTLAVRIREKSDIVFSVTPLKSPKNDRIFHGSAAYDAGSEL